MQGETSWRDAVLAAVHRLTGSGHGVEFSRASLIEAELDTIVRDTGSQGGTPQQTLSRVLQELRDEGLILFVDDEGNYRTA